MATRVKKKKSHNRSKEIDRILQNNLQTGVMVKEDIYFARKFLNIVLEADDDLPSIGDPSGLESVKPLPRSREASPADFTSDQNQVDFEASLDDGTDKEAFIAQREADQAELALLETEYKAKQKAREDAIKKLAEVAGLTEEEINAIL